jgi:hypothetical protein
MSLHRGGVADRVHYSTPLTLLLLVASITFPATAQPVLLDYAPHGEVNPFTGVVAWSTDRMPSSISMEWAFVGLSDVLPSCDAPTNLDWSSVEAALSEHAARGHQTILRPVTIGPGCTLTRKTSPLRPCRFYLVPGA